jgi:transposase
MMIAIGADVHKRKCALAMQLEDGNLKMLPSMENTRENWLELLRKLPPNAEIALEVSTSGHYVMSVLEEAGWRERGHWVHTAGIDSLRKQKYDRLDAKRLARKLSVADRDPLPEAWFPPPPIRQLRLRARQRCWTAVGRTQCRNRLRSLLQMYGLRPTRSPFRAAGREWLKQQGWPEAAREYAECTLRVHDFLEAERDRSEVSLQAASAAFPEIARLQTIPGIGHILAAVIWSEIGDLSRFASADALANYTGLVPSLYESGEVTIQGGITRQGPVWLRWALITAANAVTRSKTALGRRYWRLRRRKRPNVAKAAVAVSIARCVYGVLKHGGAYQEERWGRRAGDETKQEA